jgi:hypothetical protein
MALANKEGFRFSGGQGNCIMKPFKQTADNTDCQAEQAKKI